MDELLVVFPMAGNGMRFGGTFKPFLYATERKFIELAKEPFRIYEEDYKVTYVFIFRKYQDIQYNVKEQLSTLFPNENIKSGKNGGSYSFSGNAPFQYFLSFCIFVRNQ